MGLISRLTDYQVTSETFFVRTVGRICSTSGGRGQEERRNNDRGYSLNGSISNDE